MRRPLQFAFAALVAALVAAPAVAQPARPVPYPVMPPPMWEAAVDAGTRTDTGLPGPNYWMNEAEYTLRARLEPETEMLHGEGTIRYVNNSPDTLSVVLLKLRQNLHREDAMRNRRVYLTGGITIEHLRVDGVDAPAVEGAPEPGQYQIDQTVLSLAPAAPIPPGGEVTVDIGWRYRIAPAGPLAVRNGQDGEVFYIGYWYPQVAVYDDVYGWDAVPYMGLGEHYMNFADYDVTIDAPAGWLVWSTGELRNAEAVLPPAVRARLDQAMASSEVVHVVTEDQLGAGTATLGGERLQWRFTADDVRDVAFSASNRQVWDATRAFVDRDGNGSPESPVLINSFYRPGLPSWNRSAEFAAFSIEHLSELLGYGYPWSHMTVIEGIIGGGMEYPMMTLIGGARTDRSLFGVTYHEISHMWFPMIAGQNETSYTWMDEGLTSYNTNEGMRDFFDGSTDDRPEYDAWARNAQAHYFLAGTGFAVEPMRHNDQYPVTAGAVRNPAGAARTVASYSTPAVLLRAIEGSYGRERFLAAYREYMDRWAFKNPYPWDLFNTFEDVIGEDMDWVWTPTLYETWTMDHGLASVESGLAGVTVVVADNGLAPFPAHVTAIYEGGRTETQTVPVSTWLGGAREATVRFPAGDLAEVRLDAGGYMPDVDPTNNVWLATPVSAGTE
jgi:hypothetical protein